ncbi:MAG TPA: hypothetical protein VFT58_02055, partial [Nitrososphaera sp.]|nr:hypothetical protein [Nitrososphaera sp.]
RPIMRLPLSGIARQRAEERRARMQRALIHYEAKIGGELFGPVPKGHRREFFCLDERTWVWHEEWKDENGQNRAVTTRYDIRPNQILKSQGHFSYQALTETEERNFRQAAKLYLQRVRAEYGRMLGQA